MKDYIIERVLQVAIYIIEEKATVRSAGKHFGISKSSIHKDITERLPIIDKDLYNKATFVLKTNKDERHIRGGLATKKKYEVKSE
ncbi:MAG: sporulation transcriptional regulator SpoIIID [Lachnospirales bacterium]